MFLLISCSLVVAFQYFLCFVYDEGQQASRKEYITKRLASFIASLVLSTWAKVGRRFRPFIPRCSRTCLCTQLLGGGGFGFSTFFIQKELYFLCLPGNEEFAVTVREGVDTLQDIFEQRNH